MARRFPALNQATGAFGAAFDSVENDLRLIASILSQLKADSLLERKGSPQSPSAVIRECSSCNKNQNTRCLFEMLS
jgi:hypothetical protein